jgi:hypothetical protein
VGAAVGAAVDGEVAEAGLVGTPGGADFSSAAEELSSSSLNENWLIRLPKEL